MARRTDIDWKSIKDDYEIRGIGYRELAEKYGISKGGISLKANSQGWIKSKIEPVIGQKVEVIQQLSRINREIMNLEPEAVHYVEREVDRRLRLAGMIFEGIEKSQMLVNDSLDAIGLIDEPVDKIRAIIVATDNHSKVTQRNATVIFGAVPDNKGAKGEESRSDSIVNKLKEKHARGE